MKTIRSLISSLFVSAVLIACALPAFFVSGCATSATTQQTEYKTLAMVGATAKATMQSAVTLEASGQITYAQYMKVANFYDNNFQPAYNLAFSIAQADTSVASPDLIALSTQFASLLASYIPTKK